MNFKEIYINLDESEKFELCKIGWNNFQLKELEQLEGASNVQK